MNVILLAHTPEPDALVAAAARICYKDITASELLKGEEENLSRKLIAELFKSGHMSTFAHVRIKPRSFSSVSTAQSCKFQPAKSKIRQNDA